MSFIWEDTFNFPYRYWYSKVFQISTIPVPGLNNEIHTIAPRTNHEGTSDSYYTLESVYIPDSLTGQWKRKPHNGRNLRRIRSNVDGGYLKAIVPDPIENMEGCIIEKTLTPDETNTVFELFYWSEDNWSKYQCILFNDKLWKTITLNSSGPKDFQVRVKFWKEPPQLDARINFKPRIFQAPFKYCFRAHNGLYISQNPTAPYLRFSTNLSLWESFHLNCLIYPNVYCIYNPSYNRYIAIEADGTVGYRDNAQNSYNPKFFPEAQFRIHYAPEVIDYSLYEDTRGKFMIQNVAYGTYFATDSVLPWTVATQVIMTNNITTVNGTYEKHFWELIPQEWNKIGTSIEYPPLQAR